MINKFHRLVYALNNYLMTLKRLDKTSHNTNNPFDQTRITSRKLKAFKYESNQIQYIQSNKINIKSESKYRYIIDHLNISKVLYTSNEDLRYCLNSFIILFDIVYK